MTPDEKPASPTTTAKGVTEALTYELWLRFGTAFGTFAPIDLIPEAREGYWNKQPEDDWSFEGEDQTHYRLGKRSFREAAQEILAALSLPASPTQGELAVKALDARFHDRAREKLKLWFFRDMSDEQRLKLFSLFGLPADEIGKSHGHQSIALKHVLSALDRTTLPPTGGGAASEIEQLRAERDALLAKINSPETEDWMAGVPLEAAHQIERWGAEHDAGKSAWDWFWLIGYLSQKASASQVAGDLFKAKHHTISTAAALLNWHRHLTGESTAMCPGIDPVARGVDAAAPQGKRT